MTSNKKKITYIANNIPKTFIFLKDFVETDIFLKKIFSFTKEIQIKMEHVHETIPEEEIVKNEEYYQKMYEADVEV